MRRIPCTILAAARGAGLFVGVGAVVAGAVSVIAPGWVGGRVLFDARSLPGVSGAVVLAAGGALVAIGCLRARVDGALRVAVIAAAAALVTIATMNAVVVLRLDASGAVRTGPLPLSAFVAMTLAAAALVIVKRRDGAAATRWVVASAVACAALFPAVQMLTFGRSDYRREADAIVVFGAKAHADGRASVALADRVRTGCELWKEGRAPVLLLSGGPGEGAVHETESMRRLAVAEGVPEASIVLDTNGVSTRATAVNTATWLREHGLVRVLAVSHGYHLPRVKLEFERAGAAAFTVPAAESRVLAKMPWFMGRETVAWWASWGTGVLRAT